MNARGWKGVTVQAAPLAVAAVAARTHARSKPVAAKAGARKRAQELLERALADQSERGCELGPANANANANRGDAAARAHWWSSGSGPRRPGARVASQGMLVVQHTHARCSRSRDA